MKQTRTWCAVAVVILSSGCIVGNRQGPIKTQVLTFPSGGLIEYEGRNYGPEPAFVVLPQDEKGNLRERSEVRALPKDDTVQLASRVLDPANGPTRVPDRILIDMTGLPDGTNRVDLLERRRVLEERRTTPPRTGGRSKPTVPVGQLNPRINVTRD